MRIKPRFCECIPPINSKYVGFYLTFDEIYGPIRHLGVEQYRQLWSYGKRKGEDRALLLHFIRIATEDDSEEARKKCLVNIRINQLLCKCPK